MSTNVPQTVWRDTNGLTEYSGGAIRYIVDTLGAFLVDPSATFIIDTGVIADLIPATVWEENDSV